MPGRMGGFYAFSIYFVEERFCTRRETAAVSPRTLPGASPITPPGAVKSRLATCKAQEVAAIGSGAIKSPCSEAQEVAATDSGAIKSPCSEAQEVAAIGSGAIN
eukprot:31150-Pelagococcus_subviridis.AAC.9